MPATVRLDQTLTGTVSYKRNGSPVQAPTPVTAAVSDPAKATVTATPQIVGGITVVQLAVHPVDLATGLSLTVTGADGSVATDTIDITAAPPAVPAITWNTPTPA